MRYLSVGDMARQLGVRPSDDLCPVVAGRRLIKPEHVELIAMELRRKGVTVRSAVATKEQR